MNIFVKKIRKNNFNNTLTQLKMSAFPQISFLLGGKEMLTQCPQTGFWTFKGKVQHFGKFVHFHNQCNHMNKYSPVNFHCLHIH